MDYPGFVGASYESMAVTADQERTVNLYFEPMESQSATSRTALYPTPGLVDIPPPAVADPVTPTITNVGVPGATTYGYKVVAYLATGAHTAASPEGFTATGNAIIGGGNINRITWSAVSLATSYQVYRTTGTWGGIFGPPRNIGTTALLTLDDTTNGSLETPPAVNNTAGTVPPGPGRAHLSIGGREFAVIGTSVFEIGQFGALTLLGTVAIGGDPATISSNGDGGNELFITSGGNGYIYDLGTAAFTQIAALNGKATMGDHLDGFFLALDASTSTFYFSNLLDGLTWQTGLNFGQRSQAPDPWVSMKVNGRYIWFLGEQTSEAWYNAGSTFPFAAHPSGLIPYGIAAAFSASVGDGVLTWLGSSKAGDGHVLRMSGFTPEVVSDYPRQRIFNGYQTISDAQADTINYLGHQFYVLTFPVEDATWVFDGQTQKWFEWETWITENSAFTAIRARWHAMAFGEHRMLDASTGNVYKLTGDSNEDVDGRPIRRLRRAPALEAENQRIWFSSFELDLEPGLGTSTGQGLDPQVMMRQSRDGGKTWGNERWASAGKIGNYLTRVRWNRCGMARRAVYEVTFTDPTPFRVTAAYLTLGQPPKTSPQPQQQVA